MNEYQSPNSISGEDIDQLPKPPLARKIDAAYAALFALLCIYGTMWSFIQATMLIALLTAIRFALVRWVTKRAYAVWQCPKQ